MAQVRLRLANGSIRLFGVGLGVTSNHDLVDAGNGFVGERGRVKDVNPHV
jgi:hypothetical protein